MTTFRESDDDAALRDLMGAYQDGDIGAFDCLYRALEAELRRFFVGRCYDANRVEDLVQETFLQIHRSRRAYLRSRPLRPWVYAIAKRVFLMYLRTYRRRQSREVTALEAVEEPQVSPAADQLADHHEITSALEKIPVDGRRAFLLHHHFGLSFREIALRLGIGEHTAKLRSSRAAARLRLLVRRQGWETDE